MAAGRSPLRRERKSAGGGKGEDRRGAARHSPGPVEIGRGRGGIGTYWKFVDDFDGASSNNGWLAAGGAGSGVVCAAASFPFFVLGFLVFFFNLLIILAIARKSLRIECLQDGQIQFSRI